MATKKISVRDRELVLWLIGLGITNREMYRELREMAWLLAAANETRSELPSNWS